jgi:hypothetical protein
VEPKKTEENFEEKMKQYERDKVTYPSDPRRVPDHLFGWILKLIGIFITGLAVSQGAPFWFDLLNKFIVIRSTVKPSEKSKPQPSKDSPAPETKTETKTETKAGEEPSKD